MSDRPPVFPHATKVVDPFHTESVDELPPEPEDLTIDTVLGSGDYVPLASFFAYVKQSRIATGGELTITLGIPFEFKYEAMPLTDIRGVTLVVQVHQPVKPPSRNGQSGD